ncbi:hypothetical protein F5Y11DRAFT_14739 [Daldinia sp. FL1419]|nr:hypothetical protein F5Y11DRAFT_14739 [Daldinia sp. FL1419]
MQSSKVLVTIAMMAAGIAATNVDTVKKEETSCTCEGVTITMTVPPNESVGESFTPSGGYPGFPTGTPSTVLVTATPSSHLTGSESTPVIGSVTETVSLSSTESTKTGTIETGTGSITTSVPETTNTATQITGSGSITESHSSHTASVTTSESHSHWMTEPTASPSESAPPTSVAGSLSVGILGMTGILGGAVLVAMINYI